MQIVIDIDKSYSETVLAFLKGLKGGAVRELHIVDDLPENKKKKSVLDRAKGVLKNKITDPRAYQKALRKEWERA